MAWRSMAWQPTKNIACPSDSLRCVLEVACCAPCAKSRRAELSRSSSSASPSMMKWSMLPRSSCSKIGAE